MDASFQNGRDGGRTDSFRFPRRRRNARIFLGSGPRRLRPHPELTYAERADGSPARTFHGPSICVTANWRPPESLRNFSNGCRVCGSALLWGALSWLGSYPLRALSGAPGGYGFGREGAFLFFFTSSRQNRPPITANCNLNGDSRHHVRKITRLRTCFCRLYHNVRKACGRMACHDKRQAYSN